VAAVLMRLASAESRLAPAFSWQGLSHRFRFHAALSRAEYVDCQAPERAS
jgi:hypothetical protein